MTRTANATPAMKIACLVILAADSGHPFICPECGKPILPSHTIQFDHRQAVGRGGPNEARALAPVHAAKKGAQDAEGNPLDCHYRKNFCPRSLATGLGSDNFEAKKAPKIAAKHAINKPPIGTDRPAKPASRRLVSRPFPPRGARPMNRKRRA